MDDLALRLLQLLHGIFQKQALGQKGRCGEQPLDVRQVTGDRVPNAGKLHLDSYAPPRHLGLRWVWIGHHGAVDLANRGSGERPLIKRRKVRTPMLAKFLGHDALKLPSRHVVGSILDPQEHLFDLGRK